MRLKQQINDDAAYSSKEKEAPVNTRAQKIARLRNKKYRDAFVSSQISVGLPFQIRALREQRGWKQSRLAEKAEMLQPRISAIERPGEVKFNLETLRRIASAFDVALEVRFVPFSKLVDDSEKFNPDTFHVLSFDEDAALAEAEQIETEKNTAATGAQPTGLMSASDAFRPETITALAAQYDTYLRQLITSGPDLVPANTILGIHGGLTGTARVSPHQKTESIYLVSKRPIPPAEQQLMLALNPPAAA